MSMIIQGYQKKKNAKIPRNASDADSQLILKNLIQFMAVSM